jgi:hypothetical protein
MDKKKKEHHTFPVIKIGYFSKQERLIKVEPIPGSLISVVVLNLIILISNISNLAKEILGKISICN